MNLNKKRIIVRMLEKLNEEIIKKLKYLGLIKNLFILDILWKEFELLEYRNYKKEVDKYE